MDTGRLRIRAKGSAGGHNGLKNIIAHLGTEAFPRIRVGVGEKTEGWDLADYVLARFSKDDEPVIREAIKNAVGAVETWISDDIGTAMNRFNINPNPKPKKKPASESAQNSDNNPATDTKQVPANDPITECGQMPETDNPET